MAVLACVLLGDGVAHAQAPCVPGPAPPPVTLTAGEYYFRVDNTPTVLPGTNPYAPTAALFSPLLAGASVNDRAVRLFVRSLAQHPTYAGEVSRDGRARHLGGEAGGGGSRGGEARPCALGRGRHFINPRLRIPSFAAMGELEAVPAGEDGASIQGAVVGFSRLARVPRPCPHRA